MSVLGSVITLVCHMLAIFLAVIDLESGMICQFLPAFFHFHNQIFTCHTWICLETVLGKNIKRIPQMVVKHGDSLW